MSKKSPSPPAAPDPVATAAAQTQTNKDTAYWNAVLNNVNQVTPYGNLTYTQTGGGKQYNMDAYNTAMGAYNNSLNNSQSGGNSIPQYTYDSTGKQFANPAYTGGGTTTGGAVGTMPKLEDYLTGDAPPQFTSKIDLSPEQQQLLDTQQRSQNSLASLGEEQIGRIRDSVSTPYSYSGLGNAPTAEDIATQQSNAEKSIMDRLNPQFSKDEEALRTRLINQGIGQGSQAYQREMDSFNQKVNDARQQAVLGGQQYGATVQNEALQRRNQSISEYDAQRNAPLNEYTGITSGQQVQNPQFSSQNYQGAQPVDYAGLVNQNYQNQMAQYNAKQAGSNNALGGLFGLGGSFLGAAGNAGGFGNLFSLAAPAVAASDERLKENIKHIGKENGHSIYEFNYKGDKTKYSGVMAHEIEKTHPTAVMKDQDGFKHVNYNMIGVKMRRIHG